MVHPLVERLGLVPHPEGGWYAETWLHHSSGALELTLGGDGEHPEDPGSLVSCVVSPGFDFADFELLED